MQITVNGHVRSAPETVSLPELVSQISDRDSGIAVAVNNEVVPRSAWGECTIRPGDRIDVVTAVQGG